MLPSGTRTFASGKYVAQLPRGRSYETTLGPIAKYESQTGGGPLNSDGMEVNAGSGDCGTAVGRDLRTGAFRDNSANKAFDSACRAGTRRLAVGVVGLGSAVLAVGVLYFAYRSDGPSAQAQAMGRRTRRQLTVAPVISPTGAGATLRFAW